MWGRLGGAAMLAVLILVSFHPVPPEKIFLETPANPQGSPVTLHGRAGGFGSIGPNLPSGQSVGLVPTEALAFAQGRRAGRSVVAEDGSVLMAGVSHNDGGAANELATSGEMTIGVYQPGATRLQAIRLRAADGRESTVDAEGRHVAPTVTDLLPLPGGTVAFAAVATGFEGGWPVFGMLAKVDDQWSVAWSVTELGTDPPSRLARLRGSGDIVATSPNGSVSVLRLDGKQISVVAQHRLAGPEPPGRVHTDPTGTPGNERFAIGFGTRVQEFRYDSRSAGIQSLSPQVLPGDAHEGKPFGFGPFAYDHAGNLWLARTYGGSLAVYAKRLCDCPPDYDILQARVLGQVEELVPDSATGTIVALFGDGVLLAMRATGTGRQMRFEIGNPVDLGHNLLALNEYGWLVSRLAEFGRAGTLWIPTGRMTSPDGRPTIDHLLISVRLQELFSPAPVPLPGTRRRSVTIQAERTMTTAAVNHPGTTISVDSLAYASRCLDVFQMWSGCEYDHLPGKGFYVHDDSTYGFRDGFLEYRVHVPSDGEYALSYHVAILPNTPDVQVHLRVGTHTSDTAVFRKGGGWSTVRVGWPLHLTAGEQTVRLGVSKNHEGWYLNSFTLQRL